MVASVPNIDSLSIWVDYKRKEQQIEEYDFIKELKSEDNDIDLIIAKKNKQTLDEYYEEQAEKRKKTELQKLREKYSDHIAIEDEGDEEDVKDRILQEYEDRAKKFKEKQGSSEAELKSKSIQRLFKNPMKDD